MNLDEAIKAINELPPTESQGFEPSPALIDAIAQLIGSMELSAFMDAIRALTDRADRARMQAVNRALAKTPAFIDAMKRLHAWKNEQELAAMTDEQRAVAFTKAAEAAAWEKYNLEQRADGIRETIGQAVTAYASHANQVIRTLATLEGTLGRGSALAWIERLTADLGPAKMRSLVALMALHDAWSTVASLFEDKPT